MKTRLLSGIKITALSAALALTSHAYSEIAIIVNAANGATITQEEISNIYLGKVKFFSNGEAVAAMDHAEGSDIRQKFLAQIVDKNEAQMKSYWSRLIFTGKGVPPQIMGSDAEIVNEIAKNPNGIGYVDTSAVNGKVKVILTLK